MHFKPIWSLVKRSRSAFRGYPVATLAFYGPDDERASKAVVGLIPAEGAKATALQRWFSDETDVRSDPSIGSQIVDFIGAHGAKSIVLAERILGCPHEEGSDYPDGTACPRCPFWARRNRFTGEMLE